MKNIYNFNDYINQKENLQYKISLIYTFTSINNNNIIGLNNELSFKIAEIKSENNFKNIINELKLKNEKINKDCYIYIRFSQSDTKKVKFISNFILNNYKSDGYNYFIIIHLNRNFDKTKKEKIYTLLDIHSDINQIFIDNLNYNNNIKFEDLFKKDIKNILMYYRYELELKEEFNKALNNFLKKEFIGNMEYINLIQNFMQENEAIKETIIEITIKIIDNDKIEENFENCSDIMEKIYKDNLIKRHTIDILNFLIEYIKEEIFNNYLKKVFMILEDNNILTTLSEIKKNNYKLIHKNLVQEILINYLDEIAIDKNLFLSK